MKGFRVVIAAGTAGALAMVMGCLDPTSSSSPQGDSPDEAEIAMVMETGEAAAADLMKRLGGQLKGALQTGGPVAAIAVCRQAAMPLTEASGAAFEGVTIRRTTLKPRNPANAPDEVDRAVLEVMAEEVEPGAVVKWEEEVARFYQPLAIQEICLNCHGDSATFPEALVEALAESYPEDQATGYRLGDLRGVIRVDIERSLAEGP